MRGWRRTRMAATTGAPSVISCSLRSLTARAPLLIDGERRATATTDCCAQLTAYPAQMRGMPVQFLSIMSLQGGCWTLARRTRASTSTLSS